MGKSVPYKAIFSTVCLVILAGYFILGREGFVSEAEALSMVTCKKPACVEDMINTLGCPLCHVIPGVRGARGDFGPPLYQKIDAPKRIRDPKYKGKAKTARQYVKESILDHDAHIVSDEASGRPYPDGTLSRNWYVEKIPPVSLEILVDFISNTQPEKN